MRNQPAAIPPVFHFTKKLLFHADFQEAFMNGVWSCAYNGRRLPAGMPSPLEAPP